MWNYVEYFHANGWLFHAKKCYFTNSLFIPLVIPHTERGINDFASIGHLSFYIPRIPVLFHTIPRKVLSKSQMLASAPLPQHPAAQNHRHGRVGLGGQAPALIPMTPTSDQAASGQSAHADMAAMRSVMATEAVYDVLDDLAGALHEHQATFTQWQRRDQASKPVVTGFISGVNNAHRAIGTRPTPQGPCPVQHIPHNSTYDNLIPLHKTSFHSLCGSKYVVIIPHNSTQMIFIPHVLFLFHIITKIKFPYNSTLTKQIPHPSIFISRNLKSNSTLINVE